MLISNSVRGDLQVWDLDSERPMLSLELPKVSTAALLDERRLLMACFPYLRILDLETGLKICEFEHPGRVTALTLLQGGFVVSSCEDGFLRVMTAERLFPFRLIRVELPVHALAALDSKLIVACCPGGILQIVDVESGNVLREQRTFSAEISSISVLPGLRFVVGSSEGDLLLQAIGGPSRKIFRESSLAITSLFSLSGTRVVAGSLDGKVHVWDFKDDGGGMYPKDLLPAPGIRTIAALPAERAVSGAEDGTLRVWELENGSLIRTLKETTSVITAITALDGRRIVAGTSSGALVIWGLSKGQVLRRLTGQSSEISGLVALDPERIASLSSQGKLYLHNLATDEMHRLKPQLLGEEIWGLLPGGWVVWGKTGVQQWYIENLESARTVEVRGPSQGITAMALLDERWLVTGCELGDLCVFDLTTGRMSSRFKGHSSRVRALAALWKGSFASGSANGTLCVWDVGDRSAVASLTLDNVITSIAFSPDEHGIIVGDARGNLHCFDLAFSVW